MTNYTFICIEGVDGVGKTTITNAVAEAIGGTYYKTPPWPFTLIRPLVDQSASPATRFYYYISSVLWASQDIRKLRRRTPVVCDRYLYSTIAYHEVLEPGMGARRYANLPIERPDYSALLVASPAIRRERLKRRGDYLHLHDAQLERDVFFLDAVEAEFKKLNLDVVDTSRRSVKEITATILNRSHLLKTA